MAKPMNRVLICGGRKFTDAAFLRTALENLLFYGPTIPPDLFIIEGACPTGADELAYQWRILNRLDGQRYPVVNSIDGPWPAAGHRRNARMLRLGMPDRGIAFPGGPGTANMVKLMKKAGLRVIELKP